MPETTSKRQATAFRNLWRPLTWDLGRRGFIVVCYSSSLERRRAFSSASLFACHARVSRAVQPLCCILRVSNCANAKRSEECIRSNDLIQIPAEWKLRLEPLWWQKPITWPKQRLLPCYLQVSYEYNLPFAYRSLCASWSWCMYARKSLAHEHVDSSIDLDCALTPTPTPTPAALQLR